MSSRSKRVGSRYETDLRDWGLAAGYDIDRLALNGSKDLGDLHIRTKSNGFMVVEAKNVAKLALPEWWEEAQTEADNHEDLYGRPSFPWIVHKRRGHGTGKSWLTASLEDGLEFMRFEGVL